MSASKVRLDTALRSRWLFAALEPMAGLLNSRGPLTAEPEKPSALHTRGAIDSNFVPIPREISR
jgi:hypothetical protein